VTTKRFGPYTVETSSEDKVFFPDSGITKGDLIDYYERIADTMLPYMQRRPVVMHRFPDGIGADGFYHKDAPDHFLARIDTERIAKRQGGSTRYVICGNQATLVYLANQGCVTPHVWLSRRDEPDQPDRIVLDIDPSGDDFEPVREAAKRVCALFEDLGLAVYLQVTGSRGVHVVAPIRRDVGFDEARRFVRGAAALLAERHPEDLTVEQRKEKRRERVYIGAARNAFGQTLVTPYAVRALPGAPVATPITRDELGDRSIGPQSWTVRTIFRRLGQREDPWSSIGRAARPLAPAIEALERLG